MKKRGDWGEGACLPAQSTSEFDMHLVRQHLWELSLASRGVVCSDNGNKRKEKIMMHFTVKRAGLKVFCEMIKYSFKRAITRSFLRLFGQHKQRLHGIEIQ